MERHYSILGLPEPSDINPSAYPSIGEGFKITRKIGAGGMGDVYEGIQIKLNRKVAIKILAERLASDPEFLERFDREARAAAVINHPNLVQIFDYGEANGIHYSVMEYVDGENLAERVRRTGLIPVPEALEIISSVAEALKSAWSKKIIHRDIKPENVMITMDGHVKLADLGLTKILTEESSMTLSGMGLGSPHYMAPEQAEPAKDVDHRSDIYSLGITLLSLVTGEKAFKGNSPYAIIRAHAEQPVPSGAELGTELPASIDNLISRMAAKRPEERYVDYEELLLDITSLRTDSNATIAIPPTLREAPAISDLATPQTAAHGATTISFDTTAAAAQAAGRGRAVSIIAIVASF